MLIDGVGFQEMIGANYDAERFDVTMSNHVPMITTERAYTSPIWCTPRAK